MMRKFTFLYMFVLGVVAYAQSRFVADAEIVKSRAYLLTEADIYRWLYLVANMSQGGQSYNFTAEDKEHFRLEANKTYRLFGEDDMVLKETTTRYGYKGSRL